MRNVLLEPSPLDAPLVAQNNLNCCGKVLNRTEGLSYGSLEEVPIIPNQTAVGPSRLLPPDNQ